PQNDVTLKMPAFEWVHVQLHQQKGMISLSPPTICNSALSSASGEVQVWQSGEVRGGQVRFSAHGWSDFCPLREASLCQMP
ncbi:DUF2509 family protein, partial [Klebsiella sp. 2HUAk32cef]|uniref:DUF2509 family protein n=1 Tax=Klebsiella sp. 2HUAk32cef TaxID=3391020 RepID=UPI003983C7A4